jgi:hypothetical protein
MEVSLNENENAKTYIVNRKRAQIDLPHVLPQVPDTIPLYGNIAEREVGAQGNAALLPQA